MKMKKLFAGLVATSMVAAMGTSAFAADITETTNGATASVTEMPVPTKADSQMTVLVIKLDAIEDITYDTDGVTPIAATAPTEISDDDIIYIDQDAYAEGMFQNMGLKETLTEGYYMIRVGGENLSDGIAEMAFRVVSENEEPDTPPAPTYTYGDVDGNPGVDANDATSVLKHVALMSELTGDALLAADVDGNPDVDANDATTILKKVALMIDKFPVEN